MGDSQSKTRQVVRWALGVAIVALVLATVAGWLTASFRVATIAPAGSLEVNEARTIAPEGVESITINGVSEAIRLTDSRDGSFGVRLTGTVATSDRTAVPKLVTTRDGATLRVVVEHKPALSLAIRGANLELDVAVPKGFAGPVSVESVSGAIDASSHGYARFSARTTSGAIDLVGVRASSLTAHSVSGDLSVKELAAEEIELASTSGRINVAGAAPAIAARSVSGAITMETSAAPSRIEVSSTSGRVSLSLPRGSQFTLDARSTSGAVECGFPILVTGSGGPGHHELSGVVGGSGSGTVRLRTTSGGISVRTL